MEKTFDLKSEIVISGISGRFPQSNDLDEFWQNLVDGKDMVSDNHNRYDEQGLKMPGRVGIIKSLDKFDAEFFGVHGKQANVLDPRLRKLLEVSYEAIIDAGVNPATLQGSNTGVFVAVSDSEASAIWKRSGIKSNVYGVLGNALSMMANRLSFAFGLNGPSYIVDTACSSASVAVQHALHAIRTGLCDAALVAGAHIHHDPISSFMFHNLEMTSADGRCKVFDDSADGYARAEAAVAIYICKKQVAKRSYATLVHAGINNDGYKEQGITFPSEILQEKVIRRVYEDIGLDPLEVDYIEAHGTGTKVGDPEEMIAVSKVFCDGRKGTLLVGSVKSNMGHPEPAAGLCAIAKVLLCHCSGTIPANLHYKTPNQAIPCLSDGRAQVIDKNQPFHAKYVGLNSMGFGGTNVHILLKLENQQQPPPPWTPSIPLILLSSGRTEESVKYYLEKSLSQQQNQHFVKLVHELSKETIQRHPFRGYTITNPDKTEIVVETAEPKDSIWFVFTGMGSQWPGMARDLMKFDAFRTSIERSVEYLSNNQFDLMDIFTCGSVAKCDEFKNAMVAINTIQVALVDLLGSLGINPGGIIGHSTGEVVAGYADGCLTQKETVLTSLFRARSFLEADLPPGTVISVGLTWEEAQKRSPPNTYPAIHNAKENVTVAGTHEAIAEFMKQLEAENIFVKSIRSAIYGFHSPLVHPSGKLAEEFLEKIIVDPKPRSSKWLSSSVPEHLWNTDLVKYCSAQYYANNGINPVYFYPALLHIPENSLVLELAPHCFMISILKNSIPKSSVALGLIHVKSADNCQYFLDSMGKCYVNGINVDVGSLYEPVEFPVNSRTPNISSMIRWNYSDSWYVPHNKDETSKQKGIKYGISLMSESEKFLEGHTLDGKCIFPATGYLWLAWRFFSSEQSLDIDNCPVVFENVRFDRITLMSDRKETEFIVNILGGGKFDIMESDQVVCSGEIRSPDGALENEMLNCNSVDEIDISGPHLNKEDFYKEIHLRGYGHSGSFQGIKEIDMEGKWSTVEWTGHWVSFLDSILQTYVLRNESRDLFVPTRLEKVTIDPLEVRSQLNGNENTVKVKAWQIYEAGTCPGIELRGLSFAKFNQRLLDMKPTLTEQTFIPYLDSKEPMVLSEEKALESCVEIAVDNSFGGKFVFTEILSNLDNMVSDVIINLCLFAYSAFDFRTLNDSSEGNVDEERLATSGSRVVSLKEVQSMDQNHLVFVDSKQRFSDAESIVQPGGFVLYKGSSTNDVTTSLQLISEKRFLSNDETQTLVIFRKIPSKPSQISVISVDDPKFSWIQSTNDAMKNLEKLDRLIFTSKSSSSGIIGFIKCLVKEATSEKIRCYQAIDNLDLNFDNPSTILEQQMEKDLIYNVYKGNAWGYYVNLPISLDEFQKPRPSPFVYANALRMGELSSLSWIESPLINLKKDLVEVHYSSLNFRDIMLATGKLVQDALPGTSAQDDCVLGLEFSGDFQGRRVFGMGSSQCLATHVDPKNLILFDMPDSWSYEEAATVPAVYVTVYLALILRGRMKPGESILIHAGSGGVGQAAIAVALSMNCKVFTTVSTQKKRDFLKARFPTLTEDNFANSRDASDFQRHIKKHTNGRGVNLVLNCLAQDKLHASIRCLSKNGRFLEIGKFDLFNNTPIGLSILLKGASIYGILADQVIEEGPSDDLNALMKLMKEGIASGVVRPLNSTVFKHDQLEEAFRFMAQGKHIGKVLLQIKENVNTPASIPAYPRTYLQDKKSYIIIGGLGGMGFELANWMVHRGAKNLVLVSRTGKKSSYHEYRIRIWERRGVKIYISQSDASNEQGARTLLEEALQLGPIGGIFNTAVLLKDALLENQTPETFQDSASCKADATDNLDRVSRKLAPKLDYFVVFSSIAAARGNPGQTNYGYSNSVMERICENRKAEGLPALAIQWGAVGDVGVLHRQIGDRKTFAGLIPQRFKSCLETLDLYLQQEKPVVSSFLAVKKGDLASFDSKDSLVDIAARILGIKDVSKVNPKATLVDLGMDSLMAAELSQVLSSRSSIQISAKSYAQLTFEKLAELERNEGEGSKNEAQDLKENFKRLLEIRRTRDQAVLKMETLGTTNENLFIVHPIDGTMMTLETLAKNLNVNVYGLECVKEAPLDTIENLASFYLNKIKEIQPHGPYKIAGYSFGGLVAFEMTLQLERQNETVPLLLMLDTSANWQEIIEAVTGAGQELKRHHWENAILASMLQHYVANLNINIYKDLAALESSMDKWIHVSKVLSEAYPDLEKNEIESLIASFLARGNCSAVYAASGKVRAKTVLLRATQLGTDKVISNDYGLTSFCESPVTVVEVDGSHYCFYEKPIELGIPDIINKILHD